MDIYGLYCIYICMSFYECVWAFSRLCIWRKEKESEEEEGEVVSDAKLAYRRSAKSVATLFYSRRLALSMLSGHASESSRGNFISATLEIDIVISDGHAI